MSAWKDLVTASLLGTEKSGAAPTLPAALGEVLGPAEELAPEARFLTRAGALALWRRAGWKPGRGEPAVHPAAPPESVPLVNPTSVAHLRAMLGGHCADVLPEWLGEVALRGKRVPPEWLPALLHWAVQKHARHAPVMKAGGARLRWLAGQNPEWKFAAEEPSFDRWETGSREERLALLRRWLADNPTEARAEMAKTWRNESAETRASFLFLLSPHLSRDDEPLLESALDDRAKDVRARAAEGLGRLPKSAFAARMIARAEPLLTFKPGGLLRRATLDIQLPQEPDAAGKRDGLDPQAFGPYRKEFGDRAKGLIQILAATPPGHWTTAFGQSPEALLKAVAKHEFAAAAVTGWALAAIDRQDGAWAEALLDAPTPPSAAFLPSGGLFFALPEAAQITRLVAAVRAGAIGVDPQGTNTWAALFTQFAARRAQLPADLARELLAGLHRTAAGTPDGQLPPRLRGLSNEVALKVPPALFPEVLAGPVGEQPGLAEMTALLTFRRDALAALAQP